MKRKEYIQQIRAHSEVDLRSAVAKSAENLLKLRIKRGLAQLDKKDLLRKERKNLARLLTIANEKNFLKADRVSNKTGE
ncbi:MAG TPA: 50S ribosomal protein L29 [Oligoflexia bacterium]|nr:50S ribosomal protein L29 [Oligoflexia bacterium]HMP26490.1 50S ribosomal protein L29 [Oligoflexia bacterium]